MTRTGKGENKIRGTCLSSDPRDEEILKHDQGHLLHTGHISPKIGETLPGSPAKPMGQGDQIHDRHTKQTIREAYYNVTRE